MKVRPPLLALVAAVILVPAGLIAAYIWQAGLDLQNPPDTRKWISVCARSHEDVYCKAARRVMSEAQGPLVFLHPNEGDRDTTAELTRWKGRTPTGQELDAVARANLFRGSELTSGTVTSLDGQTREVVCGLPSERYACRIGHLRFHVQFGPHNQPRTPQDGAVYLVTGTSPDVSPMFFLPR